MNCLNHLNTELVRYSDPHCMYILKVFPFRVKYDHSTPIFGIFLCRRLTKLILQTIRCSPGQNESCLIQFQSIMEKVRPILAAEDLTKNPPRIWIRKVCESPENFIFCELGAELFFETSSEDRPLIGGEVF